MSGCPTLRRIGDFTEEERRVIRERAKYQTAGELGAVFGCDARTINAICRLPSKAPPLTEQEMIDAWNAGDPFAEIAQKALVRNGLRRAQVRAILFGRDA